MATLAPSPEPFRGGPRLYISEQLLDFGSVDLGTRVVATFHLRNTGSAPLKIESAFARVVTGCCPPTPALAKTVLRPGEASTLSLDFTMSEGMGELHLFEVVIQSNDAVQNEQVVRVQADFK